MISYDSWLEEPYQHDYDDPEPVGIAVSANRGIFNWMDFALNNQQGGVSDRAWNTLIDGPFPSVWLKIRFVLCYLNTLLDSIVWPSESPTGKYFGKDFFFVVSERCAYFADQEYYAAAFEAGENWRGRYCDALVCARESELDMSIEYYPLEEDFSDLSIPLEDS